MPRRRSTTAIAATRPVFPRYLLPSLGFALPHRPPSPTTPFATPSTSSAAPPPSPSRRVSRTAPDTLRCTACATDLALASQIISKGFTGRHGRAFLVAPPPAPHPQSLLNIRVGKSEDRQLVTGWHVVADICCATCARKLGWKYVDAREQSQKYKVGKYILETERVVTHRSWDDRAVRDDGGLGGWGELVGGAGAREGGAIQFDSEDEDECEDVFAGTWDAVAAARRRGTLRGGRV